MPISERERRRRNAIMLLDMAMMMAATSAEEQSGEAALVAPVLTWTTLNTDNTPGFDIDFTSPQVGDLVYMVRDNGTPSTSDAAEITSISPINTLTFLWSGVEAWPDDTYDVYVYFERGAETSPNSNTVAVEIAAAGDSTAPVLSSPTATSTATTTGTGSVSTDEGNGTLYFVVTTSATPPSAAQVKAGQDHTGSAATDSGSQAVSGTGVQNISGGFTGLTAATPYYAYYMHEDAAANQSTVSSATVFETFGVSYIERNVDTTDASSYSPTISFGAAATNRKIMVGIMYGKLDPAASVSSITIGGVTATLVTGATETVANGGATSTMSFYEAEVPTGTSGTLAVTFSATVTRLNYCVYRICGGTSSAGDGNSALTGTSLSITITIPTSGVGIFYGFAAANSAANAPTTITEDFDQTSETSRNHTGGRITSTGSQTGTFNWPSTGGMWMVACAYGPT